MVHEANTRGCPLAALLLVTILGSVTLGSAIAQPGQIPVPFRFIEILQFPDNLNVTITNIEDFPTGDGGGNGGSADADGDGVPDDLDEFPNDQFHSKVVFNVTVSLRQRNIGVPFLPSDTKDIQITVPSSAVALIKVSYFFRLTGATVIFELSTGTPADAPSGFSVFVFPYQIQGGRITVIDNPTTTTVVVTVEALA